jgi:Flp pilus assembly pilin Flp
MLDKMKNFLKDEEGQDLVEYALLLVFLAWQQLRFSQP